MAILSPYRGGKFRVTQKFTLGVHDGLDLVGESGKELIAPCDATVLQSRRVTDKSDRTWEWGNYVTLATAQGTRIIYAHLSKRLVKAGDVVRAGDAVGIEGNTGYSFGAHCHLEVRTAGNRVTPSVNTPAFTGIPNEVGPVDANAADGLTAEEEAVLAALDGRVAALETARPVYRWYSELPDYARATIERLHKNGTFAGAGPDDMQLTGNMARILLILAWRGLL